MTPQLTLHLTEDQFGELLAHSAPTGAATSAPACVRANAHLLACEQCATELAALRDSLSLFRHASIAYADNELRELPPIAFPSRRILSPAMQPTQWVAAAAIFLAALLPMQSMRQHAFRAAPAVSAGMPDNASGYESESESDEALLEDVDRDASASVPAPMQALADPTTSISTGITASAPNSDQRKD